jgi:predicted RND superfamily exporter protein
MDGPVKYAMVVAAVISLLLIMSKFSARVFCTGTDKKTLNKCEHLVKEIKHLYSTSKQDSQILLALVHITSAVTKCQLLTLFVTNVEAKQYLNVDLESLCSSVQKYQQTVLKGFEDMAPAIALPRNGGIEEDLFITAA